MCYLMKNLKHVQNLIHWMNVNHSSPHAYLYFQVDYILTHTAPRKVAEQLVDVLLPGEEALQYYLQDVAERTGFEEWYFGHWHMDRIVDEKYHALMEEVIRLC